MGNKATGGAASQQKEKKKEEGIEKEEEEVLPSLDESTTLLEEKTEFIPSPVPYDEEGYITSFAMDQQEEYLEFWKQCVLIINFQLFWTNFARVNFYYCRYGFVVIRNVASEEEIQASIDEIWQTLYVKSKELQDRIDALETDTESREDILVHRDDPNRFSTI